MRLVSSSEMKAIDNHAINVIGIPSTILMENAGLKILFAMEKALGGLRGKEFTIVCGKGNNGGDGLVVARHLFNNKIPIRVFLTHPINDLSADAAINANILQKSGYQPIIISDKEDLNRLRIALEFSDYAIDALYGTGFSGNIEGISAEVVNILNESRAPKIAIDVPSGLCGTTGRLSNPHVKAQYTITLGLPKLGLYLFPGIEAAGEIWVADIGIPQVSMDSVPETCALLNRDVASALLIARPDNSHKGSFGHVLLLAGSNSYRGAAILTSYGALRSGVGLVSLGLPKSLEGKLTSEILPEIICHFLPDQDGAFNLSATDIKSFAGEFRSIVAGPGWGRGQSQTNSIGNLLKTWSGGLVLDADGINAICGTSALKENISDLVITPHLGEMARLCNKPITDISRDLINTARSFAQENRCIVVLKSATPVIARPDGYALVCSRPNSGLAKGGSGDLLSGLIGGLMAQGISSFAAAAIGVFLHSEAGELARSELGADAMTISELASYLPRAFKRLRGEEKGTS